MDINKLKKSLCNTSDIASIIVNIQLRSILNAKTNLAKKRLVNAATFAAYENFGRTFRKPSKSWFKNIMEFFK